MLLAWGFVLCSAAGGLGRAAPEVLRLKALDRALDAEIAGLLASLRAEEAAALQTPPPTTLSPQLFYTVTYPHDPGLVLRVPKVFYSGQASSSETKVGQLDIGDWTRPLSFLAQPFFGRGSQAAKEERLGGVHLPLPFGLAPISLRLADVQAEKTRTRLGRKPQRRLDHWVQSVADSLTGSQPRPQSPTQDAPASDDPVDLASRLGYRKQLGKERSRSVVVSAPGLSTLTDQLPPGLLPFAKRLIQSLQQG